MREEMMYLLKVFVLTTDLDGHVVMIEGINMFYRGEWLLQERFWGPSGSAYHAGLCAQITPKAAFSTSE